MGYNKDPDRRRQPDDRDDDGERKNRERRIPPPPPQSKRREPIKIPPPDLPVRKDEQPEPPRPASGGAADKGMMPQPEISSRPDSRFDDDDDYSPATTNGLAIASLVCGIMSILFSCACGGFLFGIPSVILASMAITQINDSDGQMEGLKLARTGRGLGIAGIVLSVFWFVVMLLSGTG